MSSRPPSRAGSAIRILAALFVTVVGFPVTAPSAQAAGSLKAQPGLTTAAGPPVAAGGTISDTATLAGGASPTGNITFTVFGPNDANCAGTSAFTSNVPVAGAGNYSSGPFTTTAAGTYQFVASYSGDTNNSAVATACGAASEMVTVGKAGPTLATQATPTAAVGGSISDQATLAGGVNPTGKITAHVDFVTNPGAPCEGTSVFFSPDIPVKGNGVYRVGPFTPTMPGTYIWIVAYSGDGNNNPVNDGCNGNPAEITTVVQAAPTIVTHASAPTIVGGHLSDTAILSGGFNPTGSIDFRLFDPSDTECLNSVPPISSVVVVGNGTYPSGSPSTFTATTPGDYHFTASYSGDANNVSFTTACGDANETVTVKQAAPTIVTTASPSVPVGGTISDHAVLSGGLSPFGTITFDLFGPNDANCTGTPVFVSTRGVDGNGSFDSAGFTTTMAGTYRFVVSFSGDANNSAVTTACGDANESVVVTKVSPTIATSASPTVPAGSAISDTATLTGGLAPTGTITFTLFGPDNAACTGTPIFTSAKMVTGNAMFPSDPFTVAGVGTYNWVATYSGDANNATVMSGCGAVNESVTVTKAGVSISTHASASVAVGNPITDSASLTAGAAPTGTITFTVFGPNDPTCTGAAVFTSTMSVASGGATSAPFTPTAAGTYNFVAAYSGDPNNSPAGTACGDGNESVALTAARPTMVTRASAPVAAGGAISDTATVAGGASPTGTITFTLFGPDNAACSGAAVFTSTVPVNANGGYTSAPYTANLVGIYRFVATYGGDANNLAVTTACSDANESVMVNPATPTIATQASATATVGQTISDTAALSAGANPKGTITFIVFGPNDATCAATPAFTSTVAVNAGNGSYGSGQFTTTAPGTYRFVAAYSGDADNMAVTTLCNDANESVVVAQSNPTVVTTASAPVPVGGPVSDTATLAGGVNPTGTITFELFGPGAGCAGPPIFTSTKPVTGNGNYTSDPFTTAAPGTYHFQASYRGDANNVAVTTACSDPNETVVVTRAATALTTQASPSTLAAGGTVSDTAVLTGGLSPTGTLTFTLFGPDDATCSTEGAPARNVTVSGNGSYSSPAFTVTAAGTYSFVAQYRGDKNNQPASTACGDAPEVVTVTPAAPIIATNASPSAPAGDMIGDTATLSGGASPTGTITFRAYGPNNATCIGAPAFLATSPVSGNGTYTSSPFTAPSPGTYQFVATYSGDANNNGAAIACGDPAESVLVTLGAPQVVTVPSPSVAAGGTISDTAVVSGGANPGGTMTFLLFGPGDSTCSNAPVFTSTVAVHGDGSYTSGSFTTTATGTYLWVADYSGDADNNRGTTTSCASENVSVDQATPTITTRASASVAVGAPVTDTATLAGGTGPASITGTVTFRVFGPNDGSCTSSAVFTSSPDPVSAGVATSDPFSPTAPGVYRFVASYSGDPNNASTSTNCGDDNESVTVTSARVAVTTQASGSVSLGASINDTATITGASPAGSLTFTAFGPNDPSCAGPAVFTSSPLTTTGDGTYTSDPFTPAAIGTYHWVATLNLGGNLVGTTCGDPNESVTVSQSNPVLTTQASSPVTVGRTISDLAMLSGGTGPTGTITFNLFDPSDPTCANTPVFTSTVAVSDGNGNYPSGSFTTVNSGRYQFTASYSGDANNAAVSTNCGDPGESVDVRPMAVSVTTQASGSVPAGSDIFDTATVSGGNPSGTLTFTVFGPNDPSCNGPGTVVPPQVPVTGDGDYSSGLFTPTLPGTYSWIASLQLDGPAPGTKCGDPDESVTVTPVPPTITTRASGPIALGGTITDTATLSGGTNPTGTITFTLSGPNNDGCGSVVFTSPPVPVGVDGTATSPPFAPTAPGTYEWTASYSGDANNGPVDSGCGDPSESVEVTFATPTIVTTPSGPTPAGGSITDTAVLSGGFQPLGSLTFILFGAGDTTCSATPIFTSTVSVDGNGPYPSGSFMPLTPGAYRWVVDYSGDATANSGVTSSCGDEIGTVTLASPNLSTTASGSVAVGGAIFDTATLAGGFNPSGTIVFTAFGPNDSECTGEPVFTSTKPVTGDGAVTSDSLAPTVPGTYQFVASYRGDANNNPVSTSCGDPVEAVQVTPTTVPSTTVPSTTVPSTTVPSTTVPPTTVPPTTVPPTTVPPTTVPPTTVPPTTVPPTTVPPTTVPPTTVPPTTAPPTTPPPTTAAPTTAAPVTAPPPTRRTAPLTLAPRTTVPPTTVAPTTTTSTTTTTTLPPTGTTLGPANTLLKLDRISAPPGGSAVAFGQGCTPNSPVALSINGNQVGSAVARADGTFTATVRLNVPIGQYKLVAVCGPTLSATINVVLSSTSSPPSSTAAILMIIFLLILGLARTQLSFR